MKPSPELLPLLRSQIQGDLLALILLHPQREYTLSELASEFSVSVTTVLREVDRLIEAGILTDRRIGRSRLVSVDTESRLVVPLTDLMALTFGPLSVLEDSLRGLVGVERAFLYGSWAARYSGEPGLPPNDIDVLVVGNPDPDELFERIGAAGRTLRREVNVQRVALSLWITPGQDPFLATVKARPMVELDLAKDDV
jgi:DNA-binding transcriptional ArsR family regulator